MVVSADVPDECAAKIDALVLVLERPVWPFSTRTVLLNSLGREERLELQAYQTALAAYEAARRDRSRLRSRSAVVRKILMDYFNAGDS